MAVAASKLTVNTAETLILDATADGDNVQGLSALLRHDSASDVWLGPTGVTAAGGTEGYKWAAGDQPIAVTLQQGEKLYGIASGSAATVYVLKQGA